MNTKKNKNFKKNFIKENLSLITRLIWRPESAGRKMIENVPLVLPQETISDVRQMLFEKIKEFETINYIYVIKQDRKLVGVFSIKEIFQESKETKVRDIMEKKIIKVRPHIDQERVALLALRHNLKAIPVVDKENKFLGVVPSDVILEILHTEDIEDILHFAGVFKHDTSAVKILQAPVRTLTRIRLPWLILGLFGGVLAARIVTFFETSLKDHFILAAFIPLILYMSHAVGVQSQILFIRNLALAEFSQKNYFFKELKISVLIAFSLAVLLFFISLLFSDQLYISFILSLSLFLAIMGAILSAILIPWTLQKLKKDPALGSGPFCAIASDITSLVIYFLTTFLLLKFF